jgi:L-fuconolactonase
MVAAMDNVGVDGAIYISPFSMYQYDATYALEVQKAHPGKFALVKPVNPDDSAVADVIADWKKTPGTVGIRIIMTKESKRAPDDPGFDRILRAAVRSDFPVNVLFWGNIDAGTAHSSLLQPAPYQVECGRAELQCLFQLGAVGALAPLDSGQLGQ